MMSTRRQIIISQDDHQRLENLFFSKFAAAFGDKPYLQSLRGELNRALVVAPADMPPDVVTMNSTVCLRDVGGGLTETYTLVYPEAADIAHARLSVLAPIGTAILGYRVGDIVRRHVAGDPAPFRIENLLFQPERDTVTA